MKVSTGIVNAFLDSGVPKNSPQYTTLVMIHGYAWHAAIFSKLLPLADKYNARILLLNRRDYPGSQPYSEDELALLRPVEGEGGEQKTRDNLWTFMRARALEIYDWLATCVNDGKICTFDPSTGIGGVVVAGWSLGTTWSTALLANGDIAASVNGVDLRNVIRRVVLYDPPFQVLGYDAKSENPRFDTTLGPDEMVTVFNIWVSGYYDHGETPEEIEYRVPLKEPPPTLRRLTPQDYDAVTYDAPAKLGGSDYILVGSGIQYGLFQRLHDEAFYPTHNTLPQTEVRYVWCDRSVSDVQWGIRRLQEEMDEAKKAGKRMRPITTLRIHQANHFPHWDDPESALNALVGPVDQAKVREGYHDRFNPQI
ncbi:hypothetical protein C8Q70DRAFT_457834 [Cubamyces menziesii]|nr:hypothetical protein C8Q70DRAFT_457834 [Cubamyces menziesii]